MLEALKHGKLSRQQENMEDILTSNVFGLLQYFPEKYLLNYLRMAITLDEKPLELRPVIKPPLYDFWPPLKKGHCNFCEPDVLITLEHENAAKTFVLIEAKYKSGKSSFAEEEEDEEIEIEIEIEKEENRAATDQLAKEWQNLKILAGNHDAYVIYLTADVGIPHEAIEETQAEIRKKSGEEAKIYWLSWRHLPSIIQSSDEKMLKDLAELLKDRFRFIFFEGIKALNHPLPIEWAFMTSFGWDVRILKQIQWRFSNER